jgi:hypothetical protein
MERGVYLSVRLVGTDIASTYGSRSIAFSLVDDVETLGIHGCDNVSPLVLLLSIGVVSEVSDCLGVQ